MDGDGDTRAQQGERPRPRERAEVVVRQREPPAGDGQQRDIDPAREHRHLGEESRVSGEVDGGVLTDEVAERVARLGHGIALPPVIGGGGLDAHTTELERFAGRQRPHVLEAEPAHQLDAVGRARRRSPSCRAS